MLNILLVDDSEDKIETIRLLLINHEHATDDSITIVRDLGAARRALRTIQYDVLLLDVTIPDLPGSEPKPEAGARFAEELISRSIYKKPKEIIAITQFEDVFDRTGATFKNSMIHLIQYDATSNCWEAQLLKRLNYIEISRNDTTSDHFGVDYCILTALRNPELDAVLRLPYEWTPIFLKDDPTQYHKGKIEKSGKIFEVIAAHQPRMGSISSAAMAMKMVNAFRPRYFAMCGIAAGLVGECNIGDTLVADPTWDWGSGKYLTNGDQIDFEAAPHQISITPLIRNIITELSTESTILSQIKSQWQGEVPDSSFSIKLGPVPSGSAVVQSTLKIREIKLQHRKAIGIEMECYGLYAAVEESAMPQPMVFSIKSVSDFANEEKDDKWRKYAAYTSASVFDLIVTRLTEYQSQGG